MGRVSRFTERRVLRRAADQALTLPALERRPEPPPPRISSPTSYTPSDSDAHTHATGDGNADRRPTGPAIAPPAAEPIELQQQWNDFWDSGPGAPVDDYTPADIRADSNPEVPQRFSSHNGEPDPCYQAPADRSDAPSQLQASPATDAPYPRGAVDVAIDQPDQHDPYPTDQPIHQDLQRLGQRSIWAADYRIRPWYRTKRAAAGFAAAAALVVAAGILLVTRTPPDRAQHSPPVAPQVSTTQPAPPTTASARLSTPPSPPAPPPPPPPPLEPSRQVTPGPTWRDPTPRQTTSEDDQVPQTNVRRSPISVAPKPVTPPVTAAPGRHGSGGGWGW